VASIAMKTGKAVPLPHGLLADDLHQDALATPVVELP
jgi:hypothetical protein